MGVPARRIKTEERRVSYWIPLNNGFTLRTVGKYPHRDVQTLRKSPGTTPVINFALSALSKIRFPMVSETNPNFIRALQQNGDIHRLYFDGRDIHRVSYGFPSYENFVNFAATIRSALEELGITDAHAYVVGSAATGKSYSEGEPFDLGRVSDIEIEIESPMLFDLQTQKFSQILGRFRNEFLSKYQKACEQACQTYRQSPTPENGRKRQMAHNEYQKILGIINRLEKILARRRLPPNYKLPLGFQDLQYQTLPAFTDRPHMKIGIRISHPDISKSSDTTESSIRLF